MKRQLGQSILKPPPGKLVLRGNWQRCQYVSSSSDPGASHCPVLQKALPQLQSRFDQLASKNDGVFPILPPLASKKLAQRWDVTDKDKQASVLVPLYSQQGIPSILFTARSPHVPQNPSEISFPGGHVESGETLEQAALREAQEELLGNYPWRDPRHLKILGRGTSIPAITGTPVTPIIAVLMLPLSGNVTTHFPGHKGEVEHVFGLSLEHLYQSETSHQLPPHPVLGKDRRGPKFPSPHGDVWGLTAFILRPLLHQLYQPVFCLDKKKK